MQTIIAKQDANTNEFRRILFIYRGQTIVSVSQTIRHKIDAKPRPAEINWGAMSSKSIEEIEALGQALLEATAIAREWSKIVEDNDSSIHQPELFAVENGANGSNHRLITDSLHRYEVVRGAR
jgi:hypothetical protein